MHVPEATVELVGGPMPLSITGVSLRLRVAKSEFSAMMMPDRTVLVPQWLQPSARDAACRFASQFEKSHRIVIHELLRLAKENIKPGIMPVCACSIVKTPTVNRARELVFHLAFDEEELILHVSSTLTPCQLHANQDIRYNVGQLFVAYDVALEYMQAHTGEIEKIGFDTRALRDSMQDWQGYRERLRLV